MRTHRLGNIIINETLDISFATAEDETVPCLRHLPSLQSRVEIKLEQTIQQFRKTLIALGQGKTVHLQCDYRYVDKRDFALMVTFTRTDTDNIQLKAEVLIGNCFAVFREIFRRRDTAETIWLWKDEYVGLKPLRPNKP